MIRQLAETGDEQRTNVDIRQKSRTRQKNKHKSRIK